MIDEFQGSVEVLAMDGSVDGDSASPLHYPVGDSGNQGDLPFPCGLSGDKKSYLLAGLIGALTLISIIAACSSSLIINDVRKEPPELISYHIEPEEAGEIVSLDEADMLVRALWPDIDEGCVIKTSLKAEEQLDSMMWQLRYYDGDRYVLYAQVDASTGVVKSVTDHRYKGEIDNVQCDSQVIAIAEEVLGRMSIDAGSLPPPEVTPPNKSPGSVRRGSYSVRWDQYHRGVPVMGAFVRVRVNCETLHPVGYTNSLIRIGELETAPGVTEEEAEEAAEAFLRSEVISRKGYKNPKIASAELVIGQPCYDPYTDSLIVPLRNPQLIWYVRARDATGRSLDVEVDATSGNVIGLVEYR